MKSGFLTPSIKFLRRTRSLFKVPSMGGYERELEPYLNHFVTQRYRPPRPGTVRLPDFKLLKRISRGCFGEVVLARHEGNGVVCVLKVIRKRHLIDERDVQYVRSEREIHRCILFKFIVSLLCSFQDNANIFMCLEFIPGGDLFSLTQESRNLNETDVKFYAAQILLALEYLHKLGVIHRDLKPENVLVDADGYLKLSDLGFAKMLTGKAFTLCGTPEYFAPEMLAQVCYGKSVDYWAFGMFIYELLFDETAFRSDRRQLMFGRIVFEQLTFPLNVYCSDEGLHLMTSLLRKTPQKRLTDAARIKKHPWFRTMNFNKVYQKQFKAPIIPDCARILNSMQPAFQSDFDTSSRPLFEAEFADF